MKKKIAILVVLVTLLLPLGLVKSKANSLGAWYGIKNDLTATFEVDMVSTYDDELIREGAEYNIEINDNVFDEYYNVMNVNVLISNLYELVAEEASLQTEDFYFKLSSIAINFENGLNATPYEMNIERASQTGTTLATTLFTFENGNYSQITQNIWRLNVTNFRVNSFLYPALETKLLYEIFSSYGGEEIWFGDDTIYVDLISLYYVNGTAYFESTINELQQEIQRLQNELIKSQGNNEEIKRMLNVLSAQYNELMIDYQNLANDKTTLGSLLLTYVDIPFKVISGFLGFEVFGIELFEALSGIITMLVILWVIKRFMK